MNPYEPILDDLLSPFSFEPPSGSSVLDAPTNFAEMREEQHAANAEEDEKRGCKKRAAEERKKVLYWRGLEQLSSKEKLHLTTSLSVDVEADIDSLLTLAKDSPFAAQYLGRLALRAFAGLNALAAQGNKEAASHLVVSLYESVDRFNVVAFHRKDVFEKTTRLKDGIPGIISPHIEKKEGNDRLLSLLEVGKDYPDKLPTKRRPGRRQTSVFSTPRNLLAKQLRLYIEITKAVLNRKGMDLAGSKHQDRQWLQDAKKLPTFSASPDSCDKWAQVAWSVIMEAANGHPEAEARLRALVKEPKARTSKRTGKELPATPAAVANDIRDAIRQGFKALSGEKM